MPTKPSSAKVRSRTLFAVACVAVVAVVMSAAPAGATPPGQNGRIAFVRPRPQVASLLTIRPDGSHRRLLTQHFQIASPDWSADAAWIAYCARAPRKHSPDIWVIGSDGTHRHRITKFTGYDCDPAWSPDGEWIAFDRVVDGARRVMAVHPDGTGLHVLAGDAQDAQYSPDGERIAFTREENQHDAVYVRGVDGGPARRITPPSIRAVQPDWSPSGARIAVLAPAYRFGTSNLYTVNQDGTNLVQVTHISRAGFGILDVSWSPNGRRMVLDLDFDVMTIRAGGGHRHRIAHAIHPSHPDWGSRPAS
jgi:Tol biopolymer transport system component